MANPGFTGQQVAIRFDPHTTDHLPTPGLYLRADFFEQGWIVLFDPRIDLGAGLIETKIRVTVHQPGNSIESTTCLAPRLFQRPKPSQIDMCVSRQPDGAFAWEPVSGRFQVLPNLFSDLAQSDQL